MKLPTPDPQSIMEKNDPGLGLPTSQLPTHETVADIERPHIRYEIPEAFIGLAFEAKGFSAEDRVFRMIEITPEQQDRAAKVANNNPSVLSRELMYAAIWKVGSWNGRDNRSRLGEWWSAIGAKGRRLVEAAFMRMQSVEETDVESFLAAGKPSV